MTTVSAAGLPVAGSSNLTVTMITVSNASQFAAAIAQAMGRHDTIGLDLVAMVVDDLVSDKAGALGGGGQGAEFGSSEEADAVARERQAGIG